jgi:hypothetical protein
MSSFNRLLAGCALAMGLTLLLVTGAAAGVKADPKQEAESRAIYDAIMAGDVAHLKSLVAPGMRPTITRSYVAKLQAYLPPGQPTHVETTEVSSTITGAGTHTHLVTEYRYPKSYILLRTELDRAPGAQTDEATLFSLQAATAAEVTRHNQPGRMPVFGYVFIAIAFLYPLLTLAGMIELLYSRPKGWIWWLISMFFIPFVAIVSLCQAGGSMEHRRRLRSRAKWQDEAAEREKNRDPNEI